MERAEYIALTRKWFWLPIVLALAIGVAAAAISFRLTPIYRATTAVLVRPAQTTNQPAYFLTLDQIAKTYAQLIIKRPLVQQVITELRLPTTVTKLQQEITVAPEKDTELLDVNVEGVNGAQTALIANTLVKDFIAQNAAAEQAQLTSSLKGLQTQITDLETAIVADGREMAVLNAKTKLTPDQQAQLSNLQQKLAADSSAYATLVKGFDDIRTNQLSKSESLSVVDPATAPASPVRPNKLLNTLLGLLLGGLLGVGLAFLLEYMDNTFKSSEDIRRSLGLPVLGVLMWLRNGKPGELITLRQPRAPASEGFRELRTNLLFSGVDHGMKTILVTSSVPGEGKSRTAANLAVALGQAGRHCILVDGDLRRPTVHKLFRLIDHRGLTDMILEDRLIPEFVHATELPTLQVVCSGTAPPNPSELLGSNRMQRIIAELARSADVVVFDSPPLTAVTDAALLGARMDATVLIVEAGKTPRAAAQRAKEMLELVGAKIAGVVLNKMQSGRDLYYYDYQSKNILSAPGDGGVPLSDEGGKDRRAEVRPVPPTRQKTA